MGFTDGWIQPLARRLVTSRHTVRGFPVTVVNTRPDIETAAVVGRLGNALALIERHTPHYGRHLRRDFAGFLVQRYACRGAYFPDTRLCMVELTFCVNDTITEAQIAATILHEGMHARLHALGFPLEMEDRARQERFCRKAEIEFGRLVPGGTAIVDRALQALALEDQDVAPVIDERLAAERVARADRDAGQRGRGRPSDDNRSGEA
jgi:hypothetical protein